MRRRARPCCGPSTRRRGGENFPGLLVDFDHASHDPAQPTTAAGWIGALEHRDDGLYAQIRWSDLGHQALTGGRYRLASPVWNRADCDQWTAPASMAATRVHLRPRRLDRLALTNDPNLPGMVPLSNRKENGESEKVKGAVDASDSVPFSFPLSTSSLNPTMNLRTEILQRLGLPPPASDAEIAEALRVRRRRSSRRCAIAARASPSRRPMPTSSASPT